MNKADELKELSPAFRAGYSDGYKNIHVQPIPSGARENISDYWWGYHSGRRDRVDEQKSLLK